MPTTKTAEIIKSAPAAAIAYKYADPTEGARYLTEETEVEQIRKVDASLILDLPLTADTVSDEQIAALKVEASEAGDAKQVDLCRLALGMRPTIAWSLTPYGARSCCADAINAARAQVES